MVDEKLLARIAKLEKEKATVKIEDVAY